MSVGGELKQARERSGLSAEQIAERTKIQQHRIEALESGDFEKLPQGIYLDGIVRAYAREVSVEPDPLIERVRQEVGLVYLHGFPDEHTVATVPAFTSPARSSEPGHARVEANRVFPLLLLMVALGAGGAVLYLQARPFERDTTIGEAAQPSTQAENRRATPAAVGTAGPPDSVPDVSGKWAVATVVESSSYARFAGLQLGYDIELQQAGERVTGVGRKVTENGARIGSRAQTPISVAGTLDGEQLNLTFTERGSRRPTEGKFVLLLDDGEKLRGRFSSDAARSSGSVEARRLSR